jgi:hypothetical protein
LAENLPGTEREARSARHTDMQAGGGRSTADVRGRALAILLTCVLGCAVFGAARSGQLHKHVARGVAVVAVSGSNSLQILPHSDQHGTLASAPATAPTRSGRSVTSDSSPSVSSLPAQAPQVRGPPAKAPA